MELAIAEAAVDDEELARQLQRQLSGRYDDGSESGSDSDGESLPHGFVLDEDSDDERQRELMGGAAGTSLAEAEGRLFGGSGGPFVVRIFPLWCCVHTLHELLEATLP